MPTPAQRRRIEHANADADRVEQAAEQLRHDAIQGGYAGLRGEYSGLAMSAVLRGLALHWRHMPPALQADTLRVAHYILDGPDGRHDPRATPGGRTAPG